MHLPQAIYIDIYSTVKQEVSSTGKLQLVLVQPTPYCKIWSAPCVHAISHLSESAFYRQKTSKTNSIDSNMWRKKAAVQTSSLELFTHEQQKSFGSHENFFRKISFDPLMCWQQQKTINLQILFNRFLWPLHKCCIAYGALLSLSLSSTIGLTLSVTTFIRWTDFLVR